MRILDATCGGRSIWYQKNRPFVTFMDIRKRRYCTGGHGKESKRNWNIKPDIVLDFRNTLFKSDHFDLIIFDPPHLIRKGISTSWFSKKYGALFENEYKTIIKDGFKELFRVLKPNGILILKWSEVSKKVEEILKLSPYPPLFGTRTGQRNNTHWILFLKYNLNRNLEVYL